MVSPQTLVRDLTAKINSHVQFLTTCRPHAVSMGNAIKLLKTRILKLPGHFTEAEAKKSLIEDIDKFIQVRLGVGAFRTLFVHCGWESGGGKCGLAFPSTSTEDCTSLTSGGSANQRANQRATYFLLTLPDLDSF